MVSLVEGTGNLYPGQMGYRVVPGPLSGTTTATDALIPMYGSAMADSVAVKVPMKSDSGLTYAIPASRKRSREAVISNHHPLMSFPPSLPNQQQTDNRCGSFTFFGQDISYQIQQQQLEMDNFITEHVSLIVILIFLESGIQLKHFFIVLLFPGFMNALLNSFVLVNKTDTKNCDGS